MRRGFKTEAEEYSQEFRNELGIESHMPLCPRKLATHLAIPIMSLSDFAKIAPDAVRHLKGGGVSVFSAVTVFHGRKRLIVHNDAHHPHRQTSNIAHELAHGILAHPATPPLNEYGCRHYNKDIEDEANWLGATLLVPRPAALHIVSANLQLAEVGREYGVSQKLLKWRIAMTGVKAQLIRRSAYH